MDLETEVRFVRGVGPKTAILLNSLGIETVEDLIDNFPRKYNDYSEISNIADLEPGPVTVKIKIEDVKTRYVRRGMHLTEAVAYDDSERMKVVWFNQPYRKDQLKPDAWYFMSGEFGLSYNRMQMTNPATELVSKFPKNTARIVPVYPETKNLKSHQIRKFIYEALPLIKDLEETLPAEVVEDNGLMGRASAVEEMHFPSSKKEFIKAKDRIAFEELYEIALASLMNKRDIAQSKTKKVDFDEELSKDFVKQLHFKLTDAQRKASWKILQDIQTDQPMNRLLEGDVGSGKTAVAAMSILMALKNGYQIAYMAPTEILARQHSQTLDELLKPFGFRSQLLVGSMKKSEKEQLHKQIVNGKIGLVVGTHALISKGVDFKNLVLIVVDEQHRFGVKQREELLKKAGYMPHVLTMTATPIPRSLALTLYGELDISILDEMPPGRKPVITEVISPNSRPQLYEKIDKQIDQGRQAFVICPLISESDKLGVKSVEKEYEILNSGPFKHRSIALLHGKLKPAEKEEIMRKVIDGEIDILVSTTVIEVGVDVPNATVMLIEGVERFGLAQLHQLRGRVGRSRHQAYCYAVTSTSQKPSQRIRAFATSNDGFRLAEMDMQIRGPGEIYGARQHGALDLRVAKLTDYQQIKKARDSAQKSINSDVDLLEYPRLAKRVNQLRAITNLN